MPAAWSKKDERQYKAIVKSCRKSKTTCKRIAAATVNKRRRQQGRTGGSRCSCPRGSTQTRSGACQNRKNKRYTSKVCAR
jgi:hypothetical protein